jgi:hypothetical protein
VFSVMHYTAALRSTKRQSEGERERETENWWWGVEAVREITIAGLGPKNIPASKVSQAVPTRRTRRSYV